MDLRYFVEPLKIYGSGGQRRWQYAVRDRQSDPTDNDGHYEKIALVYEPSMAERLAALLNAPDEARWQATLDHANEQTTKERVRADLLAAELIAARAELAAANDLHRGAKERAGLERLRGDVMRDQAEEAQLKCRTLRGERDAARASSEANGAEAARYREELAVRSTPNNVDREALLAFARHINRVCGMPS